MVKTIALGAKAHIFGTLWFYGLALSGRAGVKQCIEILREEINLTLGIFKNKKPQDLNANYLSRGSDFDSLD